MLRFVRFQLFNSGATKQAILYQLVQDLFGTLQRISAAKPLRYGSHAIERGGLSTKVYEQILEGVYGGIRISIVFQA
jgi:hypothetical protein